MNLSVANSSVIYFYGGVFMYYVGIDIAKYKHDCCIIDSDKNIIKEPFTFKNDYLGFKELQTVLDSLDSNSSIKIGFESTAHYSTNLKLFLHKAHYNFMEFNPLLLHNFISSHSLRKTKTDKIDCKAIASWLTTVEFKPHPTQFYHIYSLKSFTRMYSYFMSQRTMAMCKLTNVLDHIFPEFKPFFDDKFTSTGLYILQHFPSPEKIINISDEDFISIKKKSRGHFTPNKLLKLKELAKNTVGCCNVLFEIELVSLLSLYFECDRQVDYYDDKIKIIIDTLKPKILSIPGIGYITAATLIAEIGDFNKFNSADKILAFAGLEPGHYQSGTKETEGKMTKHGSHQLRYALINAVLPLINYNMIFASYYHKKRSEGKTHYCACSHTVRKFLRLAYTLETKQINFDVKLLR